MVCRGYTGVWGAPQRMMTSACWQPHASKFDIIVEFCIQHGLYNVYEVNEILLKFDQGLIGA